MTTVNAVRTHQRLGLLRRSFAIVVVFLFILSACSSLVSAPTSTPTLTGTPAPTFTSIPTETITPSPTPIPAPERASYRLDTTLDYAAHAVTVNETIIYPNHTGGQLNELVLAVEPNLWPGGFTLTGISLDGTPTTTYSLVGQKLDVSLASFFQPEHVMTINIQYSLALPFAEQQDPNVSRPRIYGYTRNQLNLTNWYPFVVPYIKGQWVLHDPWYYGEHLVYEAADYEVNLKLAGTTLPIVAASGFPEQQGDITHYTITAARAFVISASPEFQVATAQVGDITVSSYYFPLNDFAGKWVLKTSMEALQVYSQKYGPYPHKTLSAVMGDFNDGMEYSAFFFMPRDFYGSLFDGTPKNYLTFVTAHETSHQWWFEQVGNDQAEQPWLDEALATYSEHVYYENTHPELVSWWWTYRIDFYKPQGFVDISVYDGGGFRPYTNAAYFRGAHFLDDLRHRIGDDAFFSFLQDYLAQGRGKIMTADDFFRILKTHTSTDYSDLVLQYFQNIYQ